MIKLVDSWYWSRLTVIFPWKQRRREEEEERQRKEEEEEKKAAEEAERQRETSKINFSSLRSLSDLGIDTSFLDSFGRYRGTEVQRYRGTKRACEKVQENGTSGDNH